MDKKFWGKRRIRGKLTITAKSNDSDPHMAFLLQQFPYATLQVKGFVAPQVPFGVFPFSHEGGPGIVGGAVQFPSWQMSNAQNNAPVPHFPSTLQQSPHTPAQRRLPFCFPHWPVVVYAESPAHAPS